MNKANVIRSTKFYMNVGDKIHLILKDEVGTTPVILLNSDGDDDTTLPGVPIPSEATSVLSTSFSANWGLTENATGYYLDVATDSAFTLFVSGFENKDVSNVATYSVTGLTTATIYYFRVRAYNDYQTSESSSTVTVTTA